MRKPMIAVLATLLLAAGCAADDRNDADEAFVQGMVLHHEQAVEMAEMADDATGVSPELIDLADRIAAAQQPEIDEMTGWLDDWGVEAGADHASMEGMDHSGADAMEGMMSDSAMTELASLDGAAFEQAWLQMMIEHHQGAVKSAESVIDDGSDPDVRDLAEQIVATQTDEISEMEGLSS